MNRSKVAESSPEKLLIDFPNFWIKSQKAFFAVVFLSVLVVLQFRKYTYFEPSSYTSYLSNFFNLFIHSIGIWGLYVTAKALATVQVETAIANHVKSSGEEHLRKLKNKSESRVELSKLKEQFLPYNETQPTLAIIRLFQHICKEAENLRFESSLYVMIPYREESLEAVFKIANIQKIALRLGILGTFIGLIEAIFQLTKLDLNQVDIVNIINKLSSALYVSFSTSIAGLQVSIILGFVLFLLSRQQEAYFRDMESSVEVMVSLARNANNDDYILGEFAQVNSLIEQLGKRIYEHTQEVERGLEATQQRITEQTTEIQTGIDSLRQAKLQFDNFIDEISEVERKFIGEVKSIYQDLSLKSFRDDIKEGIISAGNTVSQRIQETEERVEAQTAQIDAGIDRLIETESKFANFLQEIDESQQQFIARVVKNQNEASKSQIEDINLLKSVASELQKTTQQAIRQMRETSGTIREVNNSLNRSLVARIQSLFWK